MSTSIIVSILLILTIMLIITIIQTIKHSFYILFLSILLVIIIYSIGFNNSSASEIKFYAGLNNKNWYLKANDYAVINNIKCDLIQTNGALDNYNFLMNDKKNNIYSLGILFDFQINNNLKIIENIGNDTLYFIYKYSKITNIIDNQRVLEFIVLENSGDYLIANAIIGNDDILLRKIKINNQEPMINTILEYCSIGKCRIVKYNNISLRTLILQYQDGVFIYTLDKTGDRTKILLSNFDNFEKIHIMQIPLFIISSK